ncbi:MAG: hypothetical protein KAT48_02440 [Bacteroidales bacterium]|nr:hypothetical protein [Bacteroidales bacterium]
MEYREKIKSADTLVQTLKDEISHIVWESSMHDYTNLRNLIPSFGEQTKYAIMKLKLLPDDEKKYLILIDNFMGVYHDDFPNVRLDKKRKQNDEK